MNLQTSSSLSLLSPAPSPRVRAARPEDRREIERVLAPEIAAGTVLPRVVHSSEFLVAESADGRLLGVVACGSWSDSVLELGALVATERGAGVGRLLVQSLLARARRQGAHTVVALTAVPGFFERLGFVAQSTAPWSLARGGCAAGMSEELGEAVAYKAGRCALCPKLQRCNQTLLAAAVHPERACA